MIHKIVEDRFRVDELIGEGGMSHVYAATDLQTDRRLALKILRNDAPDPAFRERFLREAESMAKLESKHVVRIFRFGRDLGHGILYIAMELAEGDDLETLLSWGHARLPLALDLIEQICVALEDAHSKGVIHRDLKPANIKLTARRGRLMTKLLDFGFARVRQESTDARLTGDGMIPGTLTYVSPEELHQLELDWRLDLYSLGILFFEILCGVAPFKEKTPQLTAIRHLRDEPPTIDERVDGVPKEIVQLISGLLIKDRDERVQAAAEVAEVVRDVRENYGLSHFELDDDHSMLGLRERWDLIPLERD